MKVEVFGLQLNMWGLYCAIGALCGFAAIAVVCYSRGMKKGSAPLLTAVSMILGLVCSRGLYCLTMTLTKTRMPLSSWLRVTDGGWTMFGMIGGVMLAAWISAKIIREDAGKMLDAASVALPLVIVAERIGEGSLDQLFNYSRKPQNPLGEGFLTVFRPTEEVYVLATYRIAAIMGIVLFFILVFSLLSTKRKDGDLWIRFMSLCGAGGILAESLRFDHFLEFSFVRIEQVAAALMLFGGVIAAGRRVRKQERTLRLISLITFIPTITGIIGIEFALDRVSDVNRFVLYGIMIAALLIPVIHTLALQHRDNVRTVSESGEQTLNRSASGGKTGKGLAVPAAGVVLSAAEMIAISIEMNRIHSASTFLLMILLSAAAVFIIHAAVLFREIAGKR